MTRRTVLLTSRERGTRTRTWQTTTLVTIVANTSMIKTAQLISRDTIKPITITPKITGTGTAEMPTDEAAIIPETVIGAAPEIPLRRWGIRMG